MADPGKLILLVEDNEDNRIVYSTILKHFGYDVIEALNGEEGIAKARSQHPDLVLMDIRMPGMDGIEATATVLAENAQCRVIILTTFDVDRYVYDALRAGASGFLLKDVTPETLIAAIRAVMAGELLMAPTVTRRLVEQFVARPPAVESSLLAVLTDRERGVLAEIAAGLSNAEIATRLHVSEGTVKTHVSRILAKLGLRDRVQAVIAAYEHGLIPQADSSSRAAARREGDG